METKFKFTGSSINENRSGFRKPDYFLLIPEQMMKGLKHNDDIGILHVEEHKENETKTKI